ncbi:Clp protease [Modestobacter sp. DSM 44400]|nr:Clp protease [Modestobacter sp. DSM 44400]
MTGLTSGVPASSCRISSRPGHRFSVLTSGRGQTVEQIERDSDRDRFFTAEEAREYGFIDRVITHAAALPGADDNPVTGG